MQTLLLPVLNCIVQQIFRILYSEIFVYKIISNDRKIFL